MNPPNESLLTTWALNEAAPDERVGFEKSMKGDATLLAEAQATQAFCQFMQIHLRDDAAALTDAQRERVKSYVTMRPLPSIEIAPAKIQKKPVQPPAWYRRPAILLPMSAAAAVVLAFLATNPKHQPAIELADAGPVVLTAPIAMQQPTARRTVMAPSMGANADGHRPSVAPVSLKGAAAAQDVAAPVSVTAGNATVTLPTGAAPLSITTYRTPGGEDEVNGSTTVTLTKGGSSLVKLSGVNTYNGTTTITIVDGNASNSVTTIISSNGTLNAGTITGPSTGRYVGRSIQELGEATKASFSPKER